MNDSDDAIVTKKYIEYRTGVLKGVFNQISNTLQSDQCKQSFMQSVSTSKDIYSLLIETSIVDRLDRIGGTPKLLMTIAGKYFESML